MVEAAETRAPSEARREARTKPLTTALRNAALTGLVTLLLSVPLLSHLTVQTPARLVLEDRWWLAGMAVLVMTLGRLVWDLARPLAAGPGASALSHVSGRLALGGMGRHGPIVLMAFALLLPLMPFSNARVMDLATLVLTYVMLGWGLNIVVGLAGLLDLGYVAFYAVGAYSYALLGTHFGWSFWVCLPLAGILAAFWGVLLGFPVLRLRGDYLAIVTLAFGEIIRIVIQNWQSFTNGPNGILDIPRPSFFGLEFKDEGEGSFSAFFGLEFSPLHRLTFLYYIILALALLTNYVTLRLRRLPVGRAWEALREDEIACRSLGLNTTNTKLTAFAIGAMFGGFAGAFFATRQGSVYPDSFTFMESATVLAIVVLGGMGSQLGVALAAIFLTLGIEVLRDLDVLKRVFGPEFDANQYRLIVFGLAMVAIMLWRPRGLVAHRTPSILVGKGGSG